LLSSRAQKGARDRGCDFAARMILGRSGTGEAHDLSD
jgi:hypothetical protein